MKPANESGFLDVYTKEPIIEKNKFRSRTLNIIDIPKFSEARSSLPAPFWEHHEKEIQCWWKAWELAFSNIRRANSSTGFISPYIDSAFNNCLFMWDTVFILQFAKYGVNAFDFYQTLDNFYCKQHDDGFICREIKQWDGGDRFHRFDHASTGPNLLAYAEWQQYNFTRNIARLREVFPALVGYHRWMRRYRTWPDGSYWSTGWACGMDNQPRTANSQDWIFYHDHMTWVDATMQALISAQTLEKIANIIGEGTEIEDIKKEKEFLFEYIDRFLWDSEMCFYKDRLSNGKLSVVKSVGAYWCLHIDNLPSDKLKKMVGHLDDPSQFNRPHCVPSLSADNPFYNKNGGYWQGSVWPSTNYMIIDGLQKNNFHGVAQRIAVNHYEVVLDVFNDTGTFWENYSPEEPRPGSKAKKDFVGWSGLAPIALFVENILGIRYDVNLQRVHWNVQLTERHGILKYPLGNDCLVSLECKERKDKSDKPDVIIKASKPLIIHLDWPGGSKTLQVFPE